MPSVLLKFKRDLSLNNRPRLFSDLPYYENILLLQGPVGPFFGRLGNFLIQKGSKVFKINFNYADFYFSKNLLNSFNYIGLNIKWKDYVTKFYKQKNIKAIFLLGDKRFFHRIAIQVAKELGIKIYVLEEGYIRPNYFTLEEDGVNIDSQLSHTHPNELSYVNLDYKEKKFSPFLQMCWYAMQYWFFGFFFSYKFQNYKHHKNLDLKKMVFWVRGFFRFLYYEVSEFGLRKEIRQKDNQKYFLCILQVHDDFQVSHNSNYNSIDEFIEEVLLNFKEYIQNEINHDKIIIKHHPLDIGEKNYKRLIKKILKKLSIDQDRVIYIHNIRNLPLIYDKIKGGIMINSTFGLKLIKNQIPVINLSQSFYNKKGLTFQGSLLDFFKDNEIPDKKLVNNFINNLIVKSQVNGSLYSKEYEIE